MRISTKGTYALITMLDIALHQGSHLAVSLSDVAARQSISRIYLEQVVSSLRRSSLLKGIKGPQGGYILLREPALITVGDVLRASIGTLFEVSVDSKVAKESHLAPLLEKHIWGKMDTAITRMADSITLLDLMEEYRGQSERYMFYI